MYIKVPCIQNDTTCDNEHVYYMIAIKQVCKTHYNHYELACITFWYRGGASLHAPSFSRIFSCEYRRLRGNGIGGFACLFGSFLLTSAKISSSSSSSESKTSLRRTLGGTLRCISVEGLLLMRLVLPSLSLIRGRVGRKSGLQFTV